ncbi:MAG: precorrin-3B C(17)-methyltransferase [Timaviella obliquedivisa GSE-PSE-MK23-08B]|nr:precorrin-3B C(17)-methyltransferase [Timaviella obliquedivisa GSE-PSE-MK23-08B]
MPNPAIVVLNQQSVSLAHRIKAVLPHAVIYGLCDRTTEVDISFTQFGETLRELFTHGTPIIGICAAGILIRTLAPLLSDKRQEPTVLAVAEDGSAVVPLLGGLHGVNDLARQIAVVFDVSPAITTTGDIRFRTALLDPPQGYHLANPDQAKSFISDLLSGASVKIEGIAPWLSNSHLPIASDGSLTIQVTERSLLPSSNCLIYHPKTIAIALNNALSPDPEIAIAFIRQKLIELSLSPTAIAAIFALELDAGHPGIAAIAQAFNVSTRFFQPDQPAWTVETVAMTAVGASGQLVLNEAECAIALAPLPLNVNAIGRAQGRLAIVGTGPGSAEWMSPQVKELLKSATDWVGYSTYLNLVEPLRQGQQRHESDNRVELDRARQALDLAAEGRSVALISSGDPGIYAMATAVFEVIEQDAKPEWQRLEIQVAPGISAMQAAAAQVGAPIGHDFCTISLSDILKPWAVIEQRILAAAQADLVIAFYNPISSQRTWQLAKAKELLLQVRSHQTPVILARNLGRSKQAIVVTTLDQFQPETADMRTIILIGSSKTRIIQRPYGKVWVYTPRWYEG